MKRKDWIIASTREDVRWAIAEAMGFFAASTREGYARGIDEYFFRLVLDEALENALHHGNGSDPGKKIHVAVVFDGNSAEITVADEGAGFRPEAVRDPTARENLLKRRGRGIHLVKALGNAQWDESGTRIRVRLSG